MWNLSSSNLAFFATLIHFFMVVSALNVDITPKHVLQPSKTVVMLHCNTIPKDNIHITWEKDEKQIPLYPSTGTPDKSLAYVLQNNSLYIKALRRRHTGTYTCTARSGSERIFAKVTIELAYIQQFDAMTPVHAYENTQTEIVCPKILGNPEPVVTWKKNNMPINDVRFIPDGWNLKISSLRSADTGNYTCFASNIAKTRNVTALLQVYENGDLKITPPSSSITENGNASFNCVSYTKPQIPVEWKRKICGTGADSKKCGLVDIEITDSTSVKGGILTFTNSPHTDKGTYQCIVRLGSETESKDATLNIAELVKVDANRQNNVQMKDRRRQKNTRITCHFRGDGPIKFKWSRLNTTSPDLPSNMKAKNSTLDITDLKFEDAGSYQCKATGPINTATAEIKLVVYESPVFVRKPNNVSAEVGQSVWVHCSAKGIPLPGVSYLENKNGVYIPLNNSRFVTLSNGTLKIHNVNLNDRGLYLCWVKQKSLYGSTTSSFRITINEPVEEKETGSMVKTIAIAVGCAGVYILLVIGLMIYCRARRARLLRKGGIITVVDDEDCIKDPLLNGIPLEEVKSLERWQFSRENIQELETLGHGKMGRVFKANALSITEGVKKTLVAVKEFDGNGEEYKAEFDLEVEMFAQLNHDNIVRLLGVTTDSTPFYIITQFSEEGDLKSYLQQNKEMVPSDCLNMAYCIASGMEYLISLRYIHRDLAARNCLAYSDNTIRVSFLSLCEDVHKEDYFLLNDIPVPLRWLSPEAIMSENYSEKSDVWSYGVTIWEIFACGEQPYAEFDNGKVQSGVCKDLRLPKPVNCPQEVYDIMQKCWFIDHTARPSFSELTSLIADINLTE